MDLEQHNFPVTKTARYFTLGDYQAGKKEIIFALHGYGQLASYFLKNFEPVAKHERLIVAPEGHSRFYIDGVYGRVGASWMTKEDRLSEIDDQLYYLEGLARQIKTDQFESKSILGFSQGVATAWRWIRNGEVNPDHFVMWCGSIPQEFSDELLEKLARMKLTAVIAEKDEFIPVEKAMQEYNALKEKLPNLEIITFDGRHTIDQQTLKAVFP